MVTGDLNLSPSIDGEISTGAIVYGEIENDSVVLNVDIVGTGPQGPKGEKGESAISSMYLETTTDGSVVYDTLHVYGVDGELISVLLNESISFSEAKSIWENA